MQKGASSPSVKEIFLERLKKLAEQRATISVKPNVPRQSSHGDIRPSKRSKVVNRLAPQHSFDANEDDHCETSGAAYDDVTPLLHQLARLMGKSPKELVVYDPYFCNGAVMKHLACRGFPAVYNKNEDFYRMIEEGRTPEYDVLVTNPPFSGDHVEKMFRFCVNSGKPFLCLVPNYVYTKPFYTGLTTECRPFYVVPATRYEFWTPDGFRGQANERKTSPFLSFWYCNGGEWTAQMIKLWRKLERESTVLEPRTLLIQNLRYLPQRMKATFDPNRKRLRKKQRIGIKKKGSASSRSTK